MSLGPHPVRVADRVLPDPARGVDVPVRIYYPHAPGPCPVVLFSHGLGGSRLGYGYLGRYWAAHGYASVHPTHEGSDTAAVGGALPGGLAELRAVRQILDNPANAERRRRDVLFLFDALPALGALVPALEGGLDPARVAVAGHSFGAFTALLVAGLRPELAGVGLAPADPRPRAFIALSPPGIGDRGLTSESWRDIQAPLLVVTGTRDAGLAGQPPSWRTEPFELLPAGDKLLLVIEGAEHFAFSGGRPRALAPAEQLRLVEVATLAFLDAHLRAGPRVDADALREATAATPVGFTLQER